MIKKMIIAGLSCVLSLAAVAALVWHFFIYKDPALWHVKLYQTYSGWDLICDQYQDTDQHRCYLRYVDTYSLDPFGAAVFFVQHSVKNGTRLSIGLEKGSVIQSSAFVGQGSTKKSALLNGCSESSCILDAGKTGQFMMSANKAEAWQINFTEEHGEARQLMIDVSKYASAERDFITELKKRGLH